MKRKRKPMSDAVKIPKGQVTIRIRNVKTQKVEKTIKADNLIVSNFRSQVLFALAGGCGGAIGDWALTRAQLGASGVAAAVTDVAITAPLVEVALTATYPSSKSIQLDGTLTAALGNGLTFQEVGLLFSGMGLAARRVFGAVVKSATFEWDLVWVLTWP